jgi:hypothetical protein
MRYETSLEGAGSLCVIAFSVFGSVLLLQQCSLYLYLTAIESVSPMRGESPNVDKQSDH